MSGTQLQRARAFAFYSQDGRCIYCGVKMWLHDVAELGIRRRAFEQLRATAEHKNPRSEGGSASRENIAAACLRCNALRHRRKQPVAWEVFKLFVLRRVSQRKWHGRWVYDSGLLGASRDAGS
jgi:5-methylcytosine-specific restriction endonuclease McrA